MNRRGFLGRLAAIGVALSLPAIAARAPTVPSVSWVEVAGPRGVSYRALQVDGYQVFQSIYVLPELALECQGRIYMHPSKFALLAAQAA